MSAHVSQGALRIAFIGVSLVFAAQMFFRAATG
jgi:hypothetical protein